MFTDFLHSLDPLIFVSTDSDDVHIWINTTYFSLGWPGDVECHWLKWTTHVWTHLSLSFLFHHKSFILLKLAPSPVPHRGDSQSCLHHQAPHQAPALILPPVSKWSVSLRKVRSLSINSFIVFLKSHTFPVSAPTCPLDFKYYGFQQDPTLSKSSKDHTFALSVCCIFMFIINHSIHSQVHCHLPMATQRLTLQSPCHSSS